MESLSNIMTPPCGLLFCLVSPSVMDSLDPRLAIRHGLNWRTFRPPTKGFGLEAPELRELLETERWMGLGGPWSGVGGRDLPSSVGEASLASGRHGMGKAEARPARAAGPGSIPTGGKSSTTAASWAAATGFNQPLTSARYAEKTRMGKRPRVTPPSQISITSGDLTWTINTSQRYATMEKTAVTTKTPNSLIFRLSPSGIATMHAAMITWRLKAAEPTIVEGPRSPLWNPFLPVSTTDKRISGAEEPRAMRVRFATVWFHTDLVTKRLVPFTFTRFFPLVICSMLFMKRSATMLTPKKQYSNATA
mmetsp:Transcript_102799/g.209504  ORF Transcript_102799/g.209504 Transcript_102799/m.209504 type:complete len:306 (+) Transcript_102799:830-1747(+)